MLQYMKLWAPGVRVIGVTHVFQGGNSRADFFEPTKTTTPVSPKYPVHVNCVGSVIFGFSGYQPLKEVSGRHHCNGPHVSLEINELHFFLSISLS